MDESKNSHLPERAADAIPEGGVYLHNAYAWFCGQFDDIPEADKVLADIAGHDRVEGSMKRLQVEQPSAYETDSFIWRVDLAAHVLLRWALTAGQLKAYIRDPDAGETLFLGSEGWGGWELSWRRGDAIPPGPSTPYFHPNDPHNPGPLTATLRDRMRPVFFKSEEFRTWASAIVERVSAQTGRKPSGDPEIARPKEQAAAAAIRKIWGKAGPPKDLTAKMRAAKINGQLKKDGYETVSEQTIRRALRLVRHGGS